MKRHLGLLLLTALWLSGCSKEVVYREEVELTNPNKVEIVKRREVYERVLYQFKPRWWLVHEEIFLFDRWRPAWSENLRPLYLERLPDAQGYLLVAGIDNSAVCVQRGRPASYYVTFHVTKDGAKEIPTPSRLDGVRTNLFLGSGLHRKPANGREYTLAEKAERTRLGGYSERERKLLLASRFGC
jgi:hypothetical protein